MFKIVKHGSQLECCVQAASIPLAGTIVSVHFTLGER